MRSVLIVLLAHCAVGVANRFAEKYEESAAITQCHLACLRDAARR
jgi:hypothetical protein